MIQVCAAFVCARVCVCARVHAHACVHVVCVYIVALRLKMDTQAHRLHQTLSRMSSKLDSLDWP